MTSVTLKGAVEPLPWKQQPAAVPLLWWGDWPCAGGFWVRSGWWPWRGGRPPGTWTWRDWRSWSHPPSPPIRGCKPCWAWLGEERARGAGGSRDERFLNEMLGMKRNLFSAQVVSPECVTERHRGVPVYFKKTNASFLKRFLSKTRLDAEREHQSLTVQAAPGKTPSISTDFLFHRLFDLHTAACQSLVVSTQKRPVPFFFAMSSMWVFFFFFNS